MTAKRRPQDLTATTYESEEMASHTLRWWRKASLNLCEDFSGYLITDESKLKTGPEISTQ